MPPKRKAAEAASKNFNEDATDDVVHESPEKKTKTSASKSHGLQIGDKLPDIEVVDHDGETKSILDLQFPAVIFFYPKANTPGCTKQAFGFSDDYEKFKAKGYEIYGMSKDTPQAQKKWKEKYDFPYTLISDRSKDGSGIKALGTAKGTSVLRSHLVVDKNGVVEDTQYGVSPGGSVESANEFILKK